MDNVAQLASGRLLAIVNLPQLVREHWRLWRARRHRPKPVTDLQVIGPVAPANARGQSLYLVRYTDCSSGTRLRPAPP